MIKVTIRGLVVEVDSVEDLDKILERYGEGGTPAAKPEAPAAVAATEKPVSAEPQKAATSPAQAKPPRPATKQASQPSRASRSRRRRHRGGGLITSEHKANTLKLLRHLSGRTAPVHSPEIQNLLQVASPQRMIGVKAKAEALLKEHGFDPDSVYSNYGSRQGRVWRPGPELERAIQALEKAK